MVKSNSGKLCLYKTGTITKNSLELATVKPFSSYREERLLELAALKTGYKPKIINSDQGCQFTSTAWTQRLLEADMKISMDGKGSWLDNIFIERFWRTLKYEEVYLKTYESVAQARLDIGQYIHWYNTRRRHQGLGYITPQQAMEGTKIVKKSRPVAPMDLWKTLMSFPQAPQGQQQPVLIS